MPEYAWIHINRQGSKYGLSKNNVMLLYKLISTPREMAAFRTMWRSKIVCFRKIIIAFNFFCKTLHLKFLKRVLHMSRVLNMSAFWIFQDCQYARVLNFPGYTGFTYFHKYDRVLNMHRDTSMKNFRHNNVWIIYSDNAKVLNMSGQSFTGFWICLRF